MVILEKVKQRNDGTLYITIPEELQIEKNDKVLMRLDKINNNHLSKSIDIKTTIRRQRGEFYVAIKNAAGIGTEGLKKDDIICFTLSSTNYHVIPHRRVQ